MKSYRVFYKQNNKVYSISEDNDNLTIEDNDKRDLPAYNYFEMLTGYTNDLSGLLFLKQILIFGFLNYKKKELYTQNTIIIYQPLI